jgi:uncharacterized protein
MKLSTLVAVAFGATLLGACASAPAVPAPRAAQIPAAAAAEGVIFDLRHGGRSVAVETLSRSGNDLRGTVAVNEALEVSWTMELTENETARLVRWHTRRADRPATAPAVIRLDDDTSGESGDDPQSGRRALLPWFDQSAGMMEQIVRLALRRGDDRVVIPLHRLIDGRQIDAVVTFTGEREVSLEAGGKEWRLALDRNDAVVAGQATGHGVTLGRRDRLPSDVRPVWPPYGTPAGAVYQVIDVRIPAPEGHILAGTLTLPRPPGPHPAVILITGAGLNNRNQGSPPAMPFRDLADGLSSRGIAVLRLDDRGVGESTGDAATSTTQDETDDIRTALEWLRRQDGVDRARIGLVGWSEGGLIAPILAADDRDIAAVAIMNGPPTGLLAAEYQIRILVASDPSIAPDQRKQEVARILASQQSHVRSASIIATDAREHARRVRAPVLLLYAMNDQHVPPWSAAIFEALLREGGNDDVTTRLFPGLNHMFLPDPEGHAAAWPFLPSTQLPSVVITTLAEWLAETLYERDIP